jgi:hypothetical protein
MKADESGDRVRIVACVLGKACSVNGADQRQLVAPKIKHNVQPVGEQRPSLRWWRPVKGLGGAVVSDGALDVIDQGFKRVHNPDIGPGFDPQQGPRSQRPHQAVQFGRPLPSTADSLEIQFYRAAD